MRHVAIVILFVIGCRTTPLGAQMVRDSAGVHIVKYPLGAHPAAHWTVAPKPVVEVGGANGAGPTELLHITGLVRLSNGNIVVANMATNELRFFDATGKYLKAAGRSGGGPGEFAQLMGVKRFGETVQGMDGQGGPRVFTANAAFLFQTPPVPGGFRQRTQIVLADRSELRYTQEPDSMPLSYAQLVRVGSNGRESGTVIRYAVAEMAQSSRGPGPSRLEFSAGGLSAILADHVCVGFARRYTISCYRFDGTQTLDIQRDVSVLPVTDSIQKAFELAYTDVSGGNEGDGSEGAKNSLKALRLHNLPGLVYAKTLPVFVRFMAGAGDELWVRDYRAEDSFVRGGGGYNFYPAPTTSTHWNIFSSDGRWIADLTLPAQFVAFDAGTDYVLGVSRDADDVERVTMFRLRRN